MQKSQNCTPQPYQEEQIDYQSKVRSILDIPDDFLPYYNIRNSKEVAEKMKVICLIGITGVGKSSTANTLCGSTNFEESSKVQSCTQETTGKYFYWPAQNFTEKSQKQYQQSQKETPFLVVDTPGLCDTNGKDTDNIVKMVCFLKNLAYVHSFVICFNSEDPRLDENKISILKLFSEMFGKDFFDNVILCFTRWSYDKKVEIKRQKKNHGKNSVISQMNEQFKLKMKITLKNEQFIFIENDYSNPDIREDCEPEELDKNAEQLEILHNKTLNNKAFWCQDLKEVVKENDKLAQKIEKMLENQKLQQQSFQQKIEKQKKEAAEKLQQLKNEGQQKEQKYENEINEQKQLREQEKIRNEKKQKQYEKERKEERKETNEKIEGLQSTLKDIQQQQEQSRIEEKRRQQEHEEEIQEMKEQSRIESSLRQQMQQQQMMSQMFQQQFYQQKSYMVGPQYTDQQSMIDYRNGQSQEIHRCKDGSRDMRYKENKGHDKNN